MKGKYLPFIFFPILISFLFLSPLGVNGKDKDEDIVEDEKKVILCHARTPEDAKNGYNLLNVSKKSVFDKKDSEDGKGHDNHVVDIIPSFTYFVKEDVFTGEYDYKDKKKDGSCPNGYEEYGKLENCRKAKYEKLDVEKTYPGSAKWLLEAGKIVLDNDCKFPELCEYKTAAKYGEWSDWKGELGTLNIYKVRTVSAFDLIQYQLFGDEYACNTEDRYDACDMTETKTSVSAWVEDPSNTEKEIQTTIVAKVDSTDEKVICESSFTTASRDIEQGEVLGENTQQGEVLGENTQQGDVLGTTSVVLAKTGASSDLYIFIVQAVLMLGTLVSGTLLVKKYI
ncbi:hypothetical protein GX618_00775 [Candidatus Dojkabacteria bacterium]|uniref:Uncharacterized protein n=1 Tax=Candidatus Dojkabacteria bacterium TaxID=2099670 RepID=A0A847EST4_9BACT|nr:hypothetical protein [Candidatus Dojkabacteria bacterium]